MIQRASVWLARVEPFLASACSDLSRANVTTMLRRSGVRSFRCSWMSVSMKSGDSMRFLARRQLGFSPRRTQSAAAMMTMASDGLFRARSSLMSACSRRFSSVCDASRYCILRATISRSFPTRLRSIEPRHRDWILLAACASRARRSTTSELSLMTLNSLRALWPRVTACIFVAAFSSRTSCTRLRATLRRCIDWILVAARASSLSIAARFASTSARPSRPR
mmetsp:Transcript_24998/g.87134  ORF Transcript_24998/g.87134 Transcript_24998/m.87134 type:complete len:222 (-) Transcript_24998:219-884(-)